MSERLPVVDGGTPGGPAAEAVAPPPTSSSRLVATLAVAGAVAGFFIVLVHLWSQPRIEAYQARVLGEAVQEVLGGPETTTTFYLHEGDFTRSPPASVDTAGLDRIYVGYDDAGGVMGIAAAAAEPGFQDVIRLIFGFDPGSGHVLGMKVLESKETPGLGDKIVKDSAFVSEFRGVQAPLQGVKPARATGGPNEVDMITGATISSEAVVDIINHRVAALEGALRSLWDAGVPGPTATQASVDRSGPVGSPSTSPGGAP
ncbi:MAG: FMN-binding protein [Gemmatimonadota bacterium]|jgi:electron transport complex protein RnfG